MTPGIGDVENLAGGLSGEVTTTTDKFRFTELALCCNRCFVSWETGTVENGEFVVTGNSNYNYIGDELDDLSGAQSLSAFLAVLKVSLRQKDLV